MAKKSAKQAAKKAAPKRAAKAAAKRPAAKRMTTAKAAAKRAMSAKPASAATHSRSTPAERRRRFPEALRLRGLSTSLTVNDLQKSIAYYVDGLGFTIKDRWERDGRLIGVMMVAGNCEIGISQDDWAKGRDRVKGVGVRFYAETGQSLDLIAALAKERGLHADGPKVAPWGDRVVEFEDPDGFKLTILWP
jgi:catechol 2,3-dioxygenase-like lactoylglutathione lyase family enzyme